MRAALAIVFLSALALTGCENRAASYMIDGDKDHSISLVREQNWVWSSTVAQRLVVARFPECQRSFEIQPGKTGSVNLMLYQVSDRLFAAKQGASWYALGTEACQVQKFEEAPDPAPGTLIGAFRIKNDALSFVPAADGKAEE